MVRFPVFNSVMMCEYHFAKGYIYVKHVIFHDIEYDIYLCVVWLYHFCWRILNICLDSEMGLSENSVCRHTPQNSC